MENILGIISNDEIVNIKHLKSSNELFVFLCPNKYIEYTDEFRLIEFFSSALSIHEDNITLNTQYNNIEFSNEISLDIINRLTVEKPILSSFKNRIKIEKNSNEVNINVPNQCKLFFENLDCKKEMSEYITNAFPRVENISVKYYDDDKMEEKRNNIINKIDRDVKKKSNIPIVTKVYKAAADNSVKNYKKAQIKLPITPINELNSNMNKVAIRGTIIDANKKTVKGDYVIVTIVVYDNTRSITCKVFENKQNKGMLDDYAIKGTDVVVEGEYTFDSYMKEDVINLKKIIDTKISIRLDSAKKKRVELHLHSKMSSMDGFINIEEMFSKLKKWGHTSVAITDHGVLQSFPEIAKNAKGSGIKPIYGLEAYMYDDCYGYIYNPNDEKINDNYAFGFITDNNILIQKEDLNESFKITDLIEIKEYINKVPLVVFSKDNNQKLYKKMSQEEIVIIDINNILNSEKIANIKNNDISEVSEVIKVFNELLEIFNNNNLDTTNKICVYLVDEGYKKAHRNHCIILVKNYKGLKSLYEMVSYSHLYFYHKKPIIPKSIISSKRNGLIIGSACEASNIFRQIIKGSDDNVLEEMASFYDYLEIQPIGNNEFMIRNETVNNENDLINFNKKIVDIGEKLNILTVGTCDSHFFEKNDKKYREILMTGLKFDDAGLQAPLYFRTTEEMLEEFEYLSDEKAYEVVVTNTNIIADMVDFIKPIPDAMCPPKIEGSDELLRQLTIDKAKEIYGESLPLFVEERMNRELDSIISNGYSVMYIIAQKLVFQSMKDGYLVGSRGSVGSSLVAYLCGITEVNSLQAHYICDKCKYSEIVNDEDTDCGADLPDKKCPKCNNDLTKAGFDIPFETFLGFYGDKVPDIDLNFSGEYQSKAHWYAGEIFGHENVFKAGTITTIKDKTAYGFVAGYMDENSISLGKTEVNRLVKRCVGIKKTTGQHPGGIIVLPKGNSIHEFTPIQHPADDKDSSIITTHFDFHSIHDNLLKLDLLGHADPTSLKYLSELTGINPVEIDIVDKKVLQLFINNEALNVKGETTTKLGVLGISEFGTDFVRGMLESTKPTSFSELVRISGLSHGTDVWLNNAELLIKEKTATLKEAICTRDDIMIYLIHKGVDKKTSFDIMEKVRKGKGLTEEQEKLLVDTKIPKWYIESLKKIKYMFPKAHAAAYVVMALRVAWFKVYYPLEYYAVYYKIRAEEFDYFKMGRGYDVAMNEYKKLRDFERSDRKNKLSARDKSVKTILEIVIEMYARDIEFLPIDMYKSDSRRYLIEDDKLRLPFTTVPGLGETVAEKILIARAERDFISLDDIKRRTSLSKTVIDSLVEMKVINDLPDTNQVSLFDIG